MVGFCPKKLLGQPHNQQNHTISHSNMQAIGQGDWLFQFQHVLYNTPVQANGADGFKFALYLISRALEGIDARIVHTPTRRNNSRGQRCHRGSGEGDREGVDGGGIQADYSGGVICGRDQSG